jgi:hypothetical protein
MQSLLAMVQADLNCNAAEGHVAAPNNLDISTWADFVSSDGVPPCPAISNLLELQQSFLMLAMLS